MFQVDCHTWPGTHVGIGEAELFTGDEPARNY